MPRIVIFYSPHADWIFKVIEKIWGHEVLVMGDSSTIEHWNGPRVPVQMPHIGHHCGDGKAWVQSIKAHWDFPWIIVIAHAYHKPFLLDQILTIAHQHVVVFHSQVWSELLNRRDVLNDSRRAPRWLDAWVDQLERAHLLIDLSPTLRPNLIQVFNRSAPYLSLKALKLEDFKKIQGRFQAPWLELLLGKALPKTWVYTQYRPFHPLRLWSYLRQAPVWADRSRGYFWLAPRMDRSGVWDQVGRSMIVRPGGRWWANLEDQPWPIEVQRRARPPHGDRRQEIAFLGLKVPVQRIEEDLNRCLLTDEEMAYGTLGWKFFENPIPDFKWEIWLHLT